MIGFGIGLLYANAGEWFIHKNILHGVGKNRESMWSFHFHEHHQASRKNQMYDDDYRRSIFGWHGQGKELAGILGLAALHTPVALVSPGFSAAIWFSAGMYYYRHKKSHDNPEWAREHMAWHYDHHMGPDQDMNWCVTWPLFDHIMGTREYYVGTDREAKDIAKREAREARRAAKQEAIELTEAA